MPSSTSAGFTPTVKAYRRTWLRPGCGCRSPPIRARTTPRTGSSRTHSRGGAAAAAARDLRHADAADRIEAVGPLLAQRIGRKLKQRGQLLLDGIADRGDRGPRVGVRATCRLLDDAVDDAIADQVLSGDLHRRRRLRRGVAVAEDDRGGRLRR